MTDINHENWLINYYNRIQNECELSVGRRDNITRLCYMVLAAGIAVYVSFFADGNFVPPFGRFALVAGVSIVLIRFFFQSMIAYGYFLRWRSLRKQIEQYWMNNCTFTIVKEKIKSYDHGKKLPVNHQSLLKGQLTSGFGLILAVGILLLTIELYFEQSWYHYLILASLACYVGWEIYAFKTYDQMKYLPEI